MSLSSFSPRREDRGTHQHAGGVVDLCVGGTTVLLGLGLALVQPWIGLVVLVAGLALWVVGTKAWERLSHHESVADVTAGTVRVDRVSSMRPLPAPVIAQTTNRAAHGRHAHRERRPARRQSELL